MGATPEGLSTSNPVQEKPASKIDPTQKEFEPSTKPLLSEDAAHQSRRSPRPGEAVLWSKPRAKQVQGEETERQATSTESALTALVSLELERMNRSLQDPLADQNEVIFSRDEDVRAFINCALIIYKEGKKFKLPNEEDLTSSGKVRSTFATAVEHTNDPDFRSELLFKVLGREYSGRKAGNAANPAGSQYPGYRDHQHHRDIPQRQPPQPYSTTPHYFPTPGIPRPHQYPSTSLYPSGQPYAPVYSSDFANRYPPGNPDAFMRGPPQYPPYLPGDSTRPQDLDPRGRSYAPPKPPSPPPGFRTRSGARRQPDRPQARSVHHAASSSGSEWAEDDDSMNELERTTNHIDSFRHAIARRHAIREARRRQASERWGYHDSQAREKSMEPGNSQPTNGKPNSVKRGIMDWLMNGIRGDRDGAGEGTRQLDDMDFTDRSSEDERKFARRSSSHRSETPGPSAIRERYNPQYVAVPRKRAEGYMINNFDTTYKRNEESEAPSSVQNPPPMLQREFQEPRASRAMPVVAASHHHPPKERGELLEGTDENHDKVDEDTEIEEQSDDMREERQEKLRAIYLLLFLLSLPEDRSHRQENPHDKPIPSESEPTDNSSKTSSPESSDSHSKSVSTAPSSADLGEHAGGSGGNNNSSGQKRQRVDDNDGNGDDADDNGSGRRPKRNAYGGLMKIGQNLACPYAKADPFNQLSCLEVNRKNLTGVKEHLKRKHFHNRTLPTSLQKARSWDYLFKLCNEGWVGDVPSQFYNPMEVLKITMLLNVGDSAERTPSADGHASPTRRAKGKYALSTQNAEEGSEEGVLKSTMPTTPTSYQESAGARMMDIMDNQVIGNLMATMAFPEIDLKDQDQIPHDLNDYMLSNFDVDVSVPYEKVYTPELADILERLHSSSQASPPPAQWPPHRVEAPDARYSYEPSVQTLETRSYGHNSAYFEGLTGTKPNSVGRPRSERYFEDDIYPDIKTNVPAITNKSPQAVNAFWHHAASAGDIATPPPGLQNSPYMNQYHDPKQEQMRIERERISLERMRLDRERMILEQRIGIPQQEERLRAPISDGIYRPSKYGYPNRDSESTFRQRNLSSILQSGIDNNGNYPQEAWFQRYDTRPAQQTQHRDNRGEGARTQGKTRRLSKRQDMSEEEREPDAYEWSGNESRRHRRKSGGRYTIRIGRRVKASLEDCWGDVDLLREVNRVKKFSFDHIEEVQDLFEDWLVKNFSTASYKFSWEDWELENPSAETVGTELSDIEELIDWLAFSIDGYNQTSMALFLTPKKRPPSNSTRHYPRGSPMPEPDQGRSYRPPPLPPRRPRREDTSPPREYRGMGWA